MTTDIKQRLAKRTLYLCIFVLFFEFTSENSKLVLVKRLIQKIAHENDRVFWKVPFGNHPDIPSGYFLLQCATYFLTKKISRLYAGPNKSYYENGWVECRILGNCDCFY